MIRNRLTILALAALGLAAAACGSDDDATGPAPAPQAGTIRLLNESSVPIVGVYITTCDDPTWGANRLGASESLAPGALRNWTVAPGCYDVRASSGTKTASWYERDLEPGGALQLAVPASVGAAESRVDGNKPSRASTALTP